MRILIIGSGAKEYVLAKKLKEFDKVDLVFVAPSNSMIDTIATGVDISADDISSLVDFAQANEIDLTIACDEDAISSGIAEAFEHENLMIFAPTSNAARFVTSKSVCKKFMYKLKIPTPKFAIFDRDNAAYDYLKTANYPIFIKTDCHRKTESTFLCHSKREAEKCVANLFFEGEKKIIIEDCAQGRELSFYAITDGFNAFEIAPVVPFKYNLDNDTGAITKGMGAYAPAVFADEKIKSFLLHKVIYPAIKEVERNASPYTGIIGVDAIIDDNERIQVIEFNTFFNEPDINCAFSLMNNNILELMKACCIGSFSDEYHSLDIKPDFSISVVICKEKSLEETEIKGLELIDEDISVDFYNARKKEDKIFAKPGRVMGLTKTAATLSRAKKILLENLEQISFEGEKYRKDILKSLDDYK